MEIMSLKCQLAFMRSIKSLPCNILKILIKSPGYEAITVSHIQSGQTVETLVRVLHRTKPILDQLKYTMNFYHTQCKILVNGKEANQYINDHKEIVGMVLQYPKLSSIDSDLLTVIRQRLSVMVGAKKKGRINDGPDDDGCLAIQGAEPDAVQNVVCGGDTIYTCAHRSQHVSVDSIECTRCNAWMHWRCENMSEEDFEEHVCDPDSEFVGMPERHRYFGREWQK